MPKLIGQKEYDGMIAERAELRRDKEILVTEIEQLKQAFSKEKANWAAEVKKGIEQLGSKHKNALHALKAQQDLALEGAKKSVLRARQDARNARERAKRLQRALVLLEQKTALAGDWWKS